ncbi:hypothetical protein TNCV_2098851 [Trichonephila clavipes]|nr:hypothetical protein TNCV_2098851 [Trichonephila clavipes]
MAYRIYGVMILTPYPHLPIGVKYLESRLHATRFSVLYTPVSVISCPGKTCRPMACIEQCYSGWSRALETLTMRRAWHSPFTDFTTGTVIKKGGYLS